MSVVVATHGHCFDGLASAVLFTRLLRAVGPTRREVTYRGCGYGLAQPHPSEQMLDGADNAILDYRFFASDRLTWYFDHHRTAFANAADRKYFERRARTGQMYFDAGYSSCTRLIADIAKARFAFHDAGLDELVHWADVIDSAAFESAEAAVDRSNPVLRMVSVVEHYGDDQFLSEMVPKLLETPLEEVARSSEIESRYRPIGAKRERFIELVRTHKQRRGRVVFVDLTATVLETVGKFVTYALEPEATYSVMVGRLKNGVKISVGYNPWSGKPLDTDISAICARYGGGGHPVVGGISFDKSAAERARQVASAIVDELAGDGG